MTANGVFDLTTTLGTANYVPTAAHIMATTGTSTGTSIPDRRANTLNPLIAPRPPAIAIPYPPASFSVTWPTSPTSANQVTISGTAPVEVSAIAINGQPVQVTWTSEKNWSAIVNLNVGQNAVSVQGFGSFGYSTANIQTTLQRL